jgi:hypothetical protein
MLASLPQSIDSFRARRYADSSRHRPAMADLPPTLYSHWKRSAHLEFRGILSAARPRRGSSLRNAALSGAGPVIGTWCVARVE